MSGLILRLAGPLQSWGERSAFSNRDTLSFPTRSGLIGLFASAEGRGRDHSLDAYTSFGFTVRIDRPGRIIEDFHTVGGGRPAARTVPTSEGGRRSADAATLVSRRHYLADAVFVVAVTGPDDDIARIADALDRPVWAPFLGRRSCVPDEPLVLRAGVADPVTELLTSVPLSLSHRPPKDAETVPVAMVWDTPPPGRPQETQQYETTDVPLRFNTRTRSYGSRPLWRTEEHLPATLYAGTPSYEKLFAYAYGAAAAAQEGDAA